MEIYVKLAAADDIEAVHRKHVGAGVVTRELSTRSDVMSRETFPRHHVEKVSRQMTA